MRVLVACEFSGVVRRAFRERGHDAWSCDLLPAEDGSPFHYECDISIPVYEQRWDLMIAHPPCKYITNAGSRWLYTHGKGTEPDAERWNNMRAARRFFLMLLGREDIPHIAVENPRQHKHAQLPPHTQSIQPWQFGHGETKETRLWLKNLPKLVPTNIVEGREPRVHHASPGPDRWKERSRTLPGIAAAMAAQWGIAAEGAGKTGGEQHE